MPRPSAIIPVTAEIFQGHNWLIYGEPGVGKTTLAASGPKTLIVRPTTDNVVAAALSGSTAEQWVVADYGELTEVHEYLRQEKHGFEWIVFDTITLFQEVGLEGIMIDLHADKPHREVWLPDKGEYGQGMTRLAAWVRAMKALPVNFIVVAHVMKADTLSGELQYMPAIQGRMMPEKICGYMNLVAYMEVKEDKDGKPVRVLTTDKKELIYAKDGYGGAFGGRMINPTIPKMLEAVKKRIGAVNMSPPSKVVGVKKAPAKKVPTKKVAPVKKTVGKKLPAKKATTPRKVT